MLCEIEIEKDIQPKYALSTFGTKDVSSVIQPLNRFIFTGWSRAPFIAIALRNVGEIPEESSINYLNQTTHNS